MEGVLAVTFIFGGGTLFLLAISPIGRAIANRIQGTGTGAGGVPRETLDRIEGTHQDLLDEMEGLRHDVLELQERLDFAERLLARQKHESLPSPGAVADEQ